MGPFNFKLFVFKKNRFQAKDSAIFLPDGPKSLIPFIFYTSSARNKN